MRIWLRLNEWFTANKLTLSVEDWVMLLGSGQKLSTFNRPQSLTIDGRSIKQIENMY